MFKLILFMAISFNCFALTLSDIKLTDEVRCKFTVFDTFVLHTCNCFGNIVETRKEYLQYLTNSGGISIAYIGNRYICYNYRAETLRNLQLK